MGTLGVPELLIILVLVLIVFGAGKLPNVMRSMGEGVREFREASEEGSGASADKPSAEAEEARSAEPDESAD
ncbi:MAG: twin-arginine translocase TatA/TatE family subunit [Anaerolineae bacterium]